MENTLPGMWAWLLQRVSAILILIFLTLHFFLPYRRPIQFLLLAVVAFHACLGIRVFLIDLGANVATQKTLSSSLRFFWRSLDCFCVELLCRSGDEKRMV
jgi:succinate dehydrogenase / fumarate reductase cytochrome b subunit